MPVPALTLDDLITQLQQHFPVNWASAAAFNRGTLTRALLRAIAQADLAVLDALRTTQAGSTLQNAVGAQLDAVAHDFFGLIDPATGAAINELPRLAGESDANYRDRIQVRLFLRSGTRQGMIDGITSATHVAPIIVEIPDAANTGGWAAVPAFPSFGDAPSGGLSDETGSCAGPFALGTVGGWGTRGGPIAHAVAGPLALDVGGQYRFVLPAYEALITVYQPEPDSGYFLTWHQIMALVESLKPVATIMWVRVIGPASTGGMPIVDTPAGTSYDFGPGVTPGDQAGVWDGAVWT